ncbi:MAG TPA: MauE/DoxX family redox-associated membrane protein [Chryseolinea sp.]|nr:MauE/DoxX family redox-associated membrane protein [Chryseolinea sp.]
MIRQITFIIIYCLLIGLFVYAAVSKLAEYQKFVVQLGQSPITTAFAEWFAWLVPTVEIIIALMLSIPRFRLAGLYASLSLMTMFAAYIVCLLTLSVYVPCSCGGILQNMSHEKHLVFNFVCMLVALTGIVLSHQQAKSHEPDLSQLNPIRS